MASRAPRTAGALALRLLLAALAAWPSGAWRVHDNAVGVFASTMGVGAVIGGEDKVARHLNSSARYSSSGGVDSTFSEDSGGRWHRVGDDALPRHRGASPASGAAGKASASRGSRRAEAMAIVAGSRAGARPRRGGMRKGRPALLDHARLGTRHAVDFAPTSLRLRFLKWATVHMEVECGGLAVTCDLTRRCKPVSCTKVVNGVSDYTLKQARDFLGGAMQAWSSDNGRGCRVREEREDEGSCRKELFPTGGE